MPLNPTALSEMPKRPFGDSKMETVTMYFIGFFTATAIASFVGWIFYTLEEDNE